MASLRDFAVSFGTSGARGLVTDLGGAYCWTFTQAFLAVLGSGTKILLVGHDLRPSSPGIAAACISAAESRGVNGVLAGPLPTPALALAAQELGCPAIMVTGSHIPADRNGLKAYRPNGEITKADEKAMLLAEVRTPPQVLPQSRTVIEGSHLRRYIARYVDAFAPHALQGLRIGVYEHSTVGRDVLTEILGALGAKTISLGRSDTFVPVDTEAIRLEDHELATLWASEHALDAIVSADGDADRPLLADERGQWLRGDVVGILAARELGAATVVTPVSSNSSLERSGLFQKVIRTRIGSPYVIAGMESQDAIAPVVGYEANGGFLLGSDVKIGGRHLAALPTRDAMLPLLLALNAVSRDAQMMSSLVASLPPRFTHSDRLKSYATEKARTLLASLEADLKRAQTLLGPQSSLVRAVDLTDGLRVMFANGDIVHLRASGNAPELRCYTEADTPQRAQELCEDCLGRIGSLAP